MKHKYFGRIQRMFPQRLTVFGEGGSPKGSVESMRNALLEEVKVVDLQR